MNIQNKAICVMPWIHFYLDMHGNVQLCCVSNSGKELPPVIGNIKEKTIHEIYNSEYMNKIREQMIKGKWPEECSHCKYSQSIGIGSYKDTYNHKYYKEYQQLLNDPYSFKPLIKSIDLRVSNKCNYKCRSCTAYFSSAWVKEHIVVNPQDKFWKEEMGEKIILGVENIDSFWKQFNEDIFDNLEEIHFAGGEPLIIDQHYKILEKLIKNKMFHVNLYYDTNLSILKYKEWDILNLWKNFKNIRLSVSLDGVEEQGEYIRSGLNWEKWKNNVQVIKNELPHIIREMHFVISIFNILDLQNHLDVIAKNDFVGKNVSFTFLNWPDYLSVQTLHPQLKNEAEKRIRKIILENDYVFSNFNNQMESLIKYMYENDFFSEKASLFVEKTKLLDKMRKQNYLDLFPELALMEKIKTLA